MHAFIRIRSILAHAAWASLLAGSVAPAAQAADFQWSGFLSAVGGRVLSGARQEPFPADTGPNVSCPCYIADWANFGLYTKSFSFAEESRLGVQGTAKFSDALSFTGQIVSRGTDTTPKLEWAYLTYKLTPSLELQAGRKRIPLYYYSDFQDIGVAYPWVTPPAELYGWDATNYNGASLRYKTSIAGAAVTASLLAGSEKIKDDRYFLINPSPNNEHRWRRIAGGDIEVSRDWWTVRGVYVRARPEFRDLDDPGLDFDQKMEAYGLAFNADFEDWFVLSEVGTNNRYYAGGGYVKAPALSVGGGWRFGAWTPFLNYGQYWEDTDFTPDEYAPVIWRRSSLTLRYDLTPSSALKAQIEHYWEPREAYTGKAKVFRIAYDLVF